MRSLRIVGERIKRLIMRLSNLPPGAVRGLSGDGKKIKKSPVPGAFRCQYWCGRRVRINILK